MNKQTLFLFDVDGTLVDTETHKVPASTITALKQLRENGHFLGIATGRSLQSLKDGGFDTLIDWDYFLCNNGQAIYDHDKKALHCAYISEESVRTCIEIAHQQRNPILLMNEDGEYLTEQPNALVYQALAFFKELVPEIKPYDGKPVIMMIAYGEMGYDYASFQKVEGICVIPGLSTYADIVLEGYQKYKGIQILLQMLQIDSYVAFGDSLNDVEMLEHAAIGIAMGNAHEDVKKIADYVSDAVSADGIYNALRALHFFDK